MKHRHSERLRNASACHPCMTQRVVPAVTVRLGASRAAGSEFHLRVVEMSRALPGLAVFNSILNVNYSFPSPARWSFKSGLMLTIVVPSAFVQLLNCTSVDGWISLGNIRIYDIVYENTTVFVLHSFLWSSTSSSSSSPWENTISQWTVKESLFIKIISESILLCKYVEWQTFLKAYLFRSECTKWFICDLSPH